MHIEAFEGKRGYYWHFRNKGRITADGESHPTMAKAIAAGKRVVTATVKEAIGRKPTLCFSREFDSKRQCVRIEWWLA